MPPILNGTAKTNTDIAIGDALVKDTTYGYLRPASAASTAIWGVAQEEVTGAAGVTPNIPYIPALADCVFSGVSSGTTTAGMIGEEVDIEGSSGSMLINEDASTTDVVRLIGLKKGNSHESSTTLEFVWNVSSFDGRGL
jgi:hypothetical protein